MCCRGDREEEVFGSASKCGNLRRVVEDKIDFPSPVFMISVDDVELPYAVDYEELRIGNAER